MGARPGRLAAIRSWRFVALWCCCCLALASGPVSALAEPGPIYEPPEETASEPPAPEGQPTCPDLELEPFEGEDAGAGEVRSLRGELDQVCAALSARLDRVRERTWWVVLESLDAAEQRATTNEKLTKLVEGSGATVVEPGEAPLPVEDAALASSSADIVESVDASGEALKGAVWFLIGALVASLIAYFLYRQVLPRA